MMAIGIHPEGNPVKGFGLAASVSPPPLHPPNEEIRLNILGWGGGVHIMCVPVAHTHIA